MQDTPSLPPLISSRTGTERPQELDRLSALLKGSCGKVSYTITGGMLGPSSCLHPPRPVLPTRQGRGKAQVSVFCGLEVCTRQLKRAIVHIHVPFTEVEVVPMP